MRRAILFVLTVILGGCVNQLAVRQATLSKLVGQPETALIQQMGVPNRTYETGGVKYLAYDEHRIDVLPGYPSYGPFFTGWYGGGFPPDVVELRCNTTFEIADGTMKGYTLRGNACG
jgi:hypothetical protein